VLNVWRAIEPSCCANMSAVWDVGLNSPKRVVGALVSTSIRPEALGAWSPARTMPPFKPYASLITPPTVGIPSPTTMVLHRQFIPSCLKCGPRIHALDLAPAAAGAPGAAVGVEAPMPKALPYAFRCFVETLSISATTGRHSDSYAKRRDGEASFL